MIAVLCGGVGAARLLAGMVRAWPAPDLTAIVNTGDDTTLHGLAISPDLDTVTYTLAGAIDPERGWGLRGETWAAMDALGRYTPQRPTGSSAGATWFSLGDRDLATHLYRTHRLAEGATLSTVTAEIAAGWGVAVRLLPMSDDPVHTMVEVEGEGEIGFQDYFVGRAHSVPITGVRFAGVDLAVPAPGVLDVIDTATAIVVAPSNPVVSIGPILALAGVRDRLAALQKRIVAISPIVGGRAIKGPADRMLAELGVPVSASGVAAWYHDVAGTIVIDTVDADLAPEIEAKGQRCVVTDTMMRTADVAAALATTAVEALEA
ncbi:MAG TPA: 2-phospho-L-lactate transferase [Acidimicrobiales bacterium]